MDEFAICAVSVKRGKAYIGLALVLFLLVELVAVWALELSQDYELLWSYKIGGLVAGGWFGPQPDNLCISNQT